MSSLSITPEKTETLEPLYQRNLDHYKRPSHSELAFPYCLASWEPWVVKEEQEGQGSTAPQICSGAVGTTAAPG